MWMIYLLSKTNLCSSHVDIVIADVLRHAEVRHFTGQALTDKNIASSEITMDNLNTKREESTLNNEVYDE